MASGFDRVKVFSCTKARQRMDMGEEVTGWIKGYKGDIVDKQVLQSSDSEFHCLSVILFCRDKPA